jgi:hypothetical protein
MNSKATSAGRVTLHPFGRDDFSRLISWLPTEADLIDWCAAFFQYPLTYLQLERYLESSIPWAEFETLKPQFDGRQRLKFDRTQGCILFG